MDDIAMMRKLTRLLRDEERLEIFNEKFHDIIGRNSKNTDLNLMEDGVVRLEELKRLTDKVGIGTLDFYKKEVNAETGKMIGRCVKFPSKDTLLLIGVCLELDARELNELLTAAGYGTYIKNLKEFIIYCGINNIVTIDDIRRKLLKYGYREQDALMNVEYGGEKDAMRDFGRRFEELCDKKGLDRRKVLEQAALLSPNAGAEKNKYYLNAFYGTKAVRIRLSCSQVKRLCASLGLVREEILDYIDFMATLGVITREERTRLVGSLHDNGFEASETQRAAFPLVDRKSVFTQQISNRMERLDWEELDDYISETFESIRSFAVFYEQVLRFEGYKNVLEFCKNFSLSEKSHYNYVAGITIPDQIPLTIFAFLMKCMTLHIYNTLMKKAGKISFNIEEDSAVYILATELLGVQQQGACLFGRLFDATEALLCRFRAETPGKIDELDDLYAEMCKLLARNILAFETKRKLKLESADDSLKKLSEKVAIGQDKTFAELLTARIDAWSPKAREEFSRLLTEKFGFSRESSLISRISV